MIINDDVSFGFTITNLLDDLTKIIILNEMEHDFTEFPIRIAIILRFDLVNAITIEFLCKSNSFFSFYKRKLKNVSISPSP